MKKRLFLIMVIFVLGCSKSENTDSPKNKDLFFNVYQEYLEKLTADTSDPKLAPTYLDSSLKHHQLSKQEFNEYLEYYKNNPEEFEQILEKINVRLKELSAEKKR